ncbi:MAG: hypothetical protein KDD69_04990, partial [Bdellovibrionales bacterium]|nr:hypothetical protein [Bdellovibrionales bacterium]
MKAERISQGAAVEQSQAGGNGAQGNEVGEKFSQLLHELLGVSGPTGMYGAAVNPMDFAPAPVGTVVEAPKGPPVQVEQEAPQEEAASEEEVVKEETQAQDAAPEERQPEGEAEVVEVVEAMTTTAAQVVETEAVAVQAVVETQATAEVAVTEEVVVDEVALERIAEEVVQKESGAGQGKPDLSVVQEAAKVVAVDHQRRFGDGTEAPQTEEQLMAYKQTERATVEFSQASADTQVPQEMQEQIVQQEVVNRQPTPKPQVRPLNDVLGQEPQAQPDASELADQLLAAQNAAIDAVVKDMKLPKGSGAEQSLRFQLGSLFRPDIPVETLGNHGAAKNIVADAVTA